MTAKTAPQADGAAALRRQRRSAAERLHDLRSYHPDPVNPALRQAFVAARAEAAATAAQRLAALDDELRRAGQPIELTEREIQALPSWSAARATAFKPAGRALGSEDLVCGTGSFVYRVTRPQRTRASMWNLMLTVPPSPDTWVLKAPEPEPRSDPQRFAYEKPLPDRLVAEAALERCDPAARAPDLDGVADEPPAQPASCGSDTCKTHCPRSRQLRQTAARDGRATTQPWRKGR